MNYATPSSSNLLGHVLFALLLSIASFSHAQDTTNATIDSLIMLLMNDNEDAAKVDVYNNLSAEYLLLDYSRSAEYSKMAYDLAKKLEYHEGLLNASLALANLNSGYMMDFAKANAYYTEALPLAQGLKDRKSEMLVYRGLSIVQRESKNLDLAMEYNQMAMAIAKEMNSYRDQSDLNSYMGSLYEEDEDTAAAIDVYAEVLALELENDFTETSNASMIAIARYYYLIKDPGQSLKYYRIALKNFERNQDVRWTSFTHSEMAHLYIYKGNLERAEQHAVKGLDMAQANKLNKEIGDNYKALIAVYTAMDSTAKVDYYSKALDSLQHSLKTLEDVVAQAPADEKQIIAEPADGMNRFLQALIIMIPILPFILLAGRGGKKQH